MSVPNSHGSSRYSYSESTPSRSKENLQKCTLGRTHNFVLFFAVCLNNFFYILFKCLSFLLLKKLVLFLVESKVFSFPVEDNWIVTVLLSVPAVYLWDVFLDQGFETNPFASVVSYLQREVGRGNLLSGLPLGLVFRFSERFFGDYFSPVREKLFSARSVGLLSPHNSLFTSLSWSWLPEPFKKLFKSLGVLVLKPSRTCSFFPFLRNDLRNIHVTFSKLLDLAVVEFLGSFLVFLVLVVSLQNNKPKHMDHLVLSIKMMVTYIGHTLLLPIRGSAYNASVILAFGLASKDCTVLGFKLLANLLAALAAGTLFKKPKHFKEKPPSPHEWPSTQFGYCCSKLEHKLVKK